MGSNIKSKTPFEIHNEKSFKVLFEVGSGYHFYKLECFLANEVTLDKYTEQLSGIVDIIVDKKI